MLDWHAGIQGDAEQIDCDLWKQSKQARDATILPRGRMAAEGTLRLVRGGAVKRAAAPVLALPFPSDDARDGF
jgi:hypothetical protein